MWAFKNRRELTRKPYKYCRTKVVCIENNMRQHSYKKKRPRGLGALLGHLLVKRIPVMYKLGSTKIPECLSQK